MRSKGQLIAKKEVEKRAQDLFDALERHLWDSIERDKATGTFEVHFLKWPKKQEEMYFILYSPDSVGAASGSFTWSPYLDIVTIPIDSHSDVIVFAKFVNPNNYEELRSGNYTLCIRYFILKDDKTSHMRRSMIELVKILKRSEYIDDKMSYYDFISMAIEREILLNV